MLVNTENILVNNEEKHGKNSISAIGNAETLLILVEILQTCPSYISVAQIKDLLEPTRGKISDKTVWKLIGQIRKRPPYGTALKMHTRRQGSKNIPVKIYKISKN